MPIVGTNSLIACSMTSIMKIPSPTLGFWVFSIAYMGPIPYFTIESVDRVSGENYLKTEELVLV